MCVALDPAAVHDTPGAVLTYRTWIAPDAQCAQLSNSSLLGAYLEQVDVPGANFAGADLSGARLQIVAIGTDFTGANLRGAGFTGSDLSGAIFRGADLTNSVMDDLSGGGTLGADFTKATMGWNQLVGGPLVNLNAMNIANSFFDGTDMMNADLSGSDSNAVRYYGLCTSDGVVIF